MKEGPGQVQPQQTLVLNPKTAHLPRRVRAGPSSCADAHGHQASQSLARGQGSGSVGASAANLGWSLPSPPWWTCPERLFMNLLEQVPPLQALPLQVPPEDPPRIRALLAEPRPSPCPILSARLCSGLSEPALIRELPSWALFLSLSTEGPGVQGALVSSPVDGPLSTQATSEGRRAISPSSKGVRGFLVISALWSTLHFPPMDALTTGWITGPPAHRSKPGEGLAFCFFQSCCLQHGSSDGTECLSGTLVRDLSEVSTEKKKQKNPHSLKVEGYVLFGVQN